VSIPIQIGIGIHSYQVEQYDVIYTTITENETEAMPTVSQQRAQTTTTM
jgi:hypothetical protein